MLKVIEDINYVPGNKYLLYLVKHKYVSSDELIKAMALELKIDDKYVHVLKPLHGKFSKVQHVYVNKKKVKYLSEKIKLSYGYANLIKKVDSVELKNYIVHFTLPRKLTTEEKIFFNYAINYFVDEYNYNFKKLNLLMKKDNDTPQKLVEALFFSILEEIFTKGKTVEIITKAVKKNDFERLSIIRNEKIKKAAKSLINQDHEDVLKYLPHNLVKKYVLFFFHKMWNKAVSKALIDLIPKNFLVKYEKSNLVMFLKSKLPFINFNDTITLDLTSDNVTLNEALKSERQRLKLFFEYFKPYYENFKRNLFVDFIDLNFREYEIEYKVKATENFMVAKSFALVRFK